MLLPELKGWVYMEICCSSYWKQKISCVSLWFVCLFFNTRGNSFATLALGCFHFARSVLGKGDWGGTRKSSANKSDLGGRQDARDIKKG